MVGLQVTRVELGIKLTVPVSMLQKYLPAPIDKLGDQLAEEVDKQVNRLNLGYYPALDFFEDAENFPHYLLQAVADVSDLAIEIVTQKISELLVPIFSNVKISNVQCLAYALPSVRPGKANARSALASHYTPNMIKFELVVSLLQRQSPSEGFEKYADNTVYRWLSEVFETVEISSARLL